MSLASSPIRRNGQIHSSRAEARYAGPPLGPVKRRARLRDQGHGLTLGQIGVCSRYGPQRVAPRACQASPTTGIPARLPRRSASERSRPARSRQAASRRSPAHRGRGVTKRVCKPRRRATLIGLVDGEVSSTFDPNLSDRRVMRAIGAGSRRCRLMVDRRWFWPIHGEELRVFVSRTACVECDPVVLWLSRGDARQNKPPSHRGRGRPAGCGRGLPGARGRVLGSPRFSSVRWGGFIGSARLPRELRCQPRTGARAPRALW
jgi:hypothetical protein